MNKNSVKQVGLYNIYSRQPSDLNIRIHSIGTGQPNETPQLLVSIDQENYNKREFLCKSIIIGDIEYVAQYEYHSWRESHLKGTIDNLQVELPNGEIISEDDFYKRFHTNKEVLI